MKYTTSKKADRKVEEHLKKIKEIIVKEFSPISIILFGGFGRGEGTYEIVKGKAMPLNDYDLYIVSKKKIPYERLEEVGRKCSKAIGKGGGEFVDEYYKIYNKNRYFHVDLRWLDYNKLNKLKRINRTFELKYGSMVIYGEDIRKEIRDVDIPTSEAFRYLMIPACHLLLVMDERRLKGKFRGDEKFYLQHHIIKTYLAIASSLIISAGKFKANYKDTVKECERIYGKEFPELIKKVKEALELKIEAYRQIRNLKERWFQARDDLTFTLSYISEKHLKIKAPNIENLTGKLYKKLPYVFFAPYLPLPEFLAGIAFFSQYYLNMLYFLRTHNLKALLRWKDIGLRIMISTFLVLHAIDKPNLIDLAYKNIKTFSEVKSKSWKDLRIALLYAFDKYFLQKLI